ncbi:protein kinase domain-containing protein [Desulfocurvus sp. DL9XJH121]
MSGRFREESAERRGQDRMPLDPPGVGVLRLSESADGDGARAVVFVDVHNQSPGGVLIETGAGLPDPESCVLQFFDRKAGTWRILGCRRAWEAGGDGAGGFWGLAFDSPGADPGIWDLPMDPADIDFLLRIPLLESVPRGAICRLLNSLRREEFAAGQRLLSQGEAGDRLFVIQEGACRVVVDKDGRTHSIAELRRGDVVGEMGVLTGEPRTASVVALDSVVAWRLDREDFEALSREQPGLLVFLTELVANRFESSQVTADRTVAKYVISKKLGKGEWSIVYQGEHRALGMPVAVKMMRHDMAMRPQFLKSFRREASLIASLRHPSIVQVFDIEEAFRTVFIIMERMDGYSLREIMDRAGRMDPHRAARILAQVCSGLAYAHERGVVHRDVKPANIYVLPGDRIKILDFGLARGPEGGEADVGGHIPGTPLYAPPEGTGKHGCGPRGDMYSVGLMAWEMVMGERPYQAATREELAQMHRTRDVPDPAAKLPDLPGPLREFILTCCRRNPKERYADMAEAGAVLAPLCGEALAGSRRMTSVYLFYPEEAQAGVRELMEEISARAKAMGVELRSAEVCDV